MSKIITLLELSQNLSTFSEMGSNAFEAIGAASDASVALNAAAETTTNPNSHWISMGAFIGAGLAMIGATGVGAGQGYAAGAVALAVSRNPEAKPAIMSSMIVGMAIAESAAIYALIIAILLIFVAPSM